MAERAANWSAEVDKSLLMAALNGHLEVVQYLVGKGAKTDTCDNDGQTPLHCASRNGHLDVVQYLVDQGAEVERGDNDGEKPIHFASRNGHLEVVQFLADQGAQVERGDNDGEKPLHFASHSGHLDVVSEEKEMNERIKNLSKLLGKNHFNIICEAFRFDLEGTKNKSGCFVTDEQLFSQRKLENNSTELLEKSGIIFRPGP